MGILSDILGRPAAVDDLGRYGRAYFEEVERSTDLAEEYGYLRERVTEVEEDLLKISDAFDGVGWSAGLPGESAREIPLKTVKQVAEVARAMNAMNPFVKRGVNARISYVFGRGVKFDGIDEIKDSFGRNRGKMFSPQAYEELERVLATDGNAFTAVPTKETDAKGQPIGAFRITLDDIEGCIANPIDKEEIWYYKRSYKVVVTKAETGEEETREETKWYASMGYYQKLKAAGKNLPRRWNKHGVEQNFVIQHTSVNKQVGWRWGVPDILPVIFWAKAYKEYLEDNASLVKAYSQLAWQVKVPNVNSGNAASAQVMRPPQRDPLTGELRNVGGTQIGTTMMEAVPATGSSVDFSKGSALASAIAAGLEVSKVVITSDPGDGNRATAETLDLPTLKAMESRQQIHVERFMEIFEFWGAKVDLNMSSQLLTIEESAGEKPEPSEYASVVFPPIQSDSPKDHAAAVGTYQELGVLFPSEVRREALENLNINPVQPWWILPTLDDNPAKKEEQERADEQAELNAEREQANVIAKQGVSGGVAAKGGAQNTNNSARDNRKNDTNKK